jgi:hypothetical protein
MYLKISLFLFLVFFLNVALGSFGSASFLGDVGEMVLLFAVSLAFVAGVLKREDAARNDKSE